MGMYPGGNIIKIAPTVSASAHTNGDVVLAKTELKNAVPSRGGCSILRSMTLFVEGAASDDDLAVLFFDNSTDLGEPINDPSSDITADEFRTASCIGVMTLDAGTCSFDVANGRLYANNDNREGSPVLLKAADRETSIWVAVIQYGGSLDFTDTDSLTGTFNIEYLG